MEVEMAKGVLAMAVLKGWVRMVAAEVAVRAVMEEEVASVAVVRVQRLRASSPGSATPMKLIFLRKS